MNNFYGMGGQPFGETMGVQYIARIGAGVNPDQMHAERVNGYDPLAVIDAFRRKKQVLEEGRGPVLLDTVTYRFSGHSPSDASSYRSKEEVERWQHVDSIAGFEKKLIDGDTFGGDELAAVARRRRSSWSSICSSLAIDPQASPRIAFDSDLVGSVMFSNARVERFDERKPELLTEDLGQNPRVAADSRKGARAITRRKTRSEDEGVQRSRRASSRHCCTASRSTRPWSPSARRIAIGAARSPSTAD